MASGVTKDPDPPKRRAGDKKKSEYDATATMRPIRGGYAKPTDTWPTKPSKTWPPKGEK